MFSLITRYPVPAELMVLYEKEKNEVSGDCDNNWFN
jgi:hypothetical protein